MSDPVLDEVLGLRSTVTALRSQLAEQAATIERLTRELATARNTAKINLSVAKRVTEAEASLAKAMGALGEIATRNASRDQLREIARVALAGLAKSEGDA